MPPYAQTAGAEPADPENPAFARFRLSRAGGLTPFGMADDGEVEDHRVEILAAPKAPEIYIALTSPDHAELSWGHVENDVNGDPIAVTEYRIYRETFPYFAPYDGTNRVDAIFGPFASPVVWTDPDPVGDPRAEFLLLRLGSRPSRGRRRRAGQLQPCGCV